MTKRQNIASLTSRDQKFKSFYNMAKTPLVNRSYEQVKKAFQNPSEYNKDLIDSHDVSKGDTSTGVHIEQNNSEF